MNRLFVAVAFVALTSACAGVKPTYTAYPPSDATMARIEAGSAKLGCGFEKIGRFGWAAGMRQAEVQCDSKRTVYFAGDSRKNIDAVLDKNVKNAGTYYECRGALKSDAAACAKLVEEIWAAGG